MASAAASLPATLFYHVLGFAICDDNLATEWTTRFMGEELHAVARVCKPWLLHTRGFECQRRLAKLTVSVKRATRSEALELRRQLTLRRPFLRELTLWATPATSTNSTTTQAALFERRATAQLIAGLAHAPQLEILDLRYLSVSNKDAASIIRAASSNCLRLQALLVHPDTTGAKASDGSILSSPDRELLMDAVLESMAQWHRVGPNGGLRQLRFADRPSTDRFRNSVRFLQHVSKYAPHIELLDGYTFLRRDGCRDQYVVDRATWEQFCHATTRLRAFDWVIAPWASAFFEIFGRHPKPQLTELTLKTSRAWNWTTFLKEVGPEEAQAMREAGFGPSTACLHHVVKACPGLKKIKFVKHTQVSNARHRPQATAAAEGREMARVMRIHEAEMRNPLPVNTMNPMNQELFGDDLCEALARHCPLVEDITVVVDDEDGPARFGRVEPIMSFTDRSLHALAKLKFLSNLDVLTVNVTGEGLFALLNSPVNEAPGKRFITVAVGDEFGPQKIAFYQAVVDMLQAMLRHEGPLHFTSRKTVFQLLNGDKIEEIITLSSSFYVRLKDLIGKVRAKYPMLKIRCSVSGWCDPEFESMSAFGILTGDIVPHESYFWDMLPSGALNDGVFIRQEYLGGLHYDDDEQEEYYSDDDAPPMRAAPIDMAQFGFVRTSDGGWYHEASDDGGWGEI